MIEWWGTVLISIASAVVSAIITGLFTLCIERNRANYSYPKLIKHPEFKAHWKEIILRPILQEIWSIKRINF